MGKTPISTEQFDKIIKFLSINYLFRFGSINPQEFGQAHFMDILKITDLNISSKIFSHKRLHAGPFMTELKSGAITWV